MYQEEKKRYVVSQGTMTELPESHNVYNAREIATKVLKINAKLRDLQNEMAELGLMIDMDTFGR